MQLAHKMFQSTDDAEKRVCLDYRSGSLKQFRVKEMIIHQLDRSFDRDTFSLFFSIFNGETTTFKVQEHPTDSEKVQTYQYVCTVFFSTCQVTVVEEIRDLYPEQFLPAEVGSEHELIMCAFI